MTKILVSLSILLFSWNSFGQPSNSNYEGEETVSASKTSERQVKRAQSRAQSRAQVNSRSSSSKYSKISNIAL